MCAYAKYKNKKLYIVAVIVRANVNKSNQMQFGTHREHRKEMNDALEFQFFETGPYSRCESLLLVKFLVFFDIYFRKFGTYQKSHRIKKGKLHTK